MNATGEFYLACIAHDRMKETMIDCLARHRHQLIHRPIIATGTTGRLIRDRLGLEVKCMQSGPLGGDQQIGSKIACGKVGAVIFLRDPLYAHPHEPDIMAFLRLCDVHFVPLATNPATAELLLANLPRIFGAPPGPARSRLTAVGTSADVVAGTAVSASAGMAAAP